MDAEPWITLQLCPGLAPQLRHRLLETYGDAVSLIKAPPSELRAAGLGGEALQSLKRPDRAAMRRCLDWLAGENAHLVPVNHPHYPALLREIHDPPAALFVLGREETLSQAHLAIVGSRSATPLGRSTATDFARALCRSGLCIVSGLAEGIDAAAHEGALDCGGPTLGICATGPDRIYPRGHEALARRIAAHGALASENPPGTVLQPWMFLRRNRLISGISAGVLVVEAARRSGANTTARTAAEQGREVFAVPGSIYSPTSRGCHALIRTGAKLVEKPEDILEELPPLLHPIAQSPDDSASAAAGGTGRKPRIAPGAARRPPGQGELPLFGRLLQQAPQSIDDLVSLTGLGASEVAAAIARLELEGRVQPLPDGRFQSSG